MRKFNARPPRILVIGDPMTDIYHCGRIVGVSAEAPIPVVKIDTTKHMPGGASNVAANLDALGATITMWCGRGDIRKHRLMVDDTQLARWDETDYCHPDPYSKVPLDYTWDAIVVADYGKGSIDNHIRSLLSDASTMVFVDTKVSPFLYGVHSVFFPNQKEYNQFKDIYDCCNSVVLKKSEHGMSLRRYGLPDYDVPAMAAQVRCVNGAGDTAIAAFAYWWCVSGGDMEEALRFANAAAACAVEKPYTSTVTIEEVSRKLGPARYTDQEPYRDNE